MADDVASLGLKVESESVAKGVSELDKLSASAKKAEDATKSQADSSTKAATASQSYANQVKQVVDANVRVASTQDVVKNVTDEAAASLTRMGGAAGVAGTALGTLGPIGLLVGSILGGVIISLNLASAAAHKFAEDMGRIRDGSQNLSLTTGQFQAISDEGAKFALSEEKIRTGFERLIGQMEQFRQRSGPAFEIIERANPALAQQIATAHNLATEIDLLGEAYTKLSASQQVALSRSLFGRGGVDLGQLIQSIRGSGGLDKLTDDFRRSGDMIDDAVIKRITQLKREIDDMSDDARRNIASIFAVPVLEAQFRFVEGFRELTRFAKNFSLSEDWKTLVTLLPKLLTMGPLDMIGANPLVGIRGDVFKLDRPEQPLPEPRDFAEARASYSGLDTKAFEAAQQGLAESADRVVQAILPEVDQMRELERRIMDITEAADAGVQAKMRYGEQAGLVAEKLITQRDALNQLRELYSSVSLAIAQQAQSLTFQAEMARAVTNEDRNAVQLKQLSIQLAQQGAAASERSLITERTRALQVAQTEGAIVQAARQSLQALQERAATLEFENSLWGKSRVEAAGLRAEWEAMAVVRQQAAATGKTEEEILEIMRQQGVVLDEVITKLRQEAEERERNREATERQKAAVQEYAAAQRKADSEREQAEKTIQRLKAEGRAMDEAMMNSFGTTGTYQGKEVSFFGTGGYVHPYSRLRESQFVGNFNSTMSLPLGQQEALAGPGGITWGEAPGVLGQTALINAQGYANIAGDILARGGGISGAISSLLKPITGNLFGEQLSTVQRLINLAPESQRAGYIEQTISQLRQQPVTLAREELIAQLTQQLEQLRKSTDSLTDSQNDILSGLYSRQFGMGFYQGGASYDEKIFGLDSAEKFDELRTATEEQAQRQVDSAEDGVNTLTMAIQDSAAMITAGLEDLGRQLMTGTLTQRTSGGITIEQTNTFPVSTTNETQFNEALSQFAERTAQELIYRLQKS